jgi:hypothetical protein
MNKSRLILIGYLVSLIWAFPVLAQITESAVSDKDVPPASFKNITTPEDLGSGLVVEERRYESRLDSVTVERDDSGVQDYYDLNDTTIERRDGGISEQGAMRVWRLGTGKN